MTLASLSLVLAVSLPNIFSNHCILQRDSATAVWGRGKAGEKVSVEIGGVQASTVTEKNGWWIVRLDTSALRDGPFRLLVKGEADAVTVEDVLVGEVWLAGGQSNMVYSMDDHPFGKIIGFEKRQRECAGRPIRVFALTTNDKTPDVAWNAQGFWRVVSPENIGGISAVAYCFIDTLQKTIGGAAGLVTIPWSGSACRAWLPPWCTNEMASVRKRIDLSAKPNMRVSYMWENRFMPVSRASYRGIIWYQGCQDSGPVEHSRDEYPEEFARMVAEMRRANGRPDLPFLYCQISGWGKPDARPQATSDSSWVRESQRRVQKRIPHSGMAVIFDNSEVEIHNRMKGPAGDRLAALALNRVYGFKDVPCQSPDFKSVTFGAKSANVTFDIGGSPLKVGPFRTTLSWNVQSNTVINIERRCPPKSELEGFAVRDGKGSWHWASAKITGSNTVKVWSAEVAWPTAVRYNWGNQGFGNLYNAAGLPASTFTTEQ